jgi:hypothetical protein
MASSTDKARTARINANKLDTSLAAYATVDRNSKAAGVNLNYSEQNKAASAIKGNMQAERERTASRAEFIANRDEANAAKARLVGGITGPGAKNVNKVYRNMGK